MLLPPDPNNNLCSSRVHLIRQNQPLEGLICQSVNLGYHQGVQVLNDEYHIDTENIYIYLKPKVFRISSPNYYSFYRLVINKNMGNNGGLTIGQLKLFTNRSMLNLDKIYYT